MAVLAIVYLAGVSVGLAATDAPPATRLGLVLLWPLGPLAFVVTVSLLVAASVIAFPRVAAGAAVAVALTWWIFR